MKKTVKTLAVLLTIIIMSAFTLKQENGFIGTYGVSEGDPSEIKLVINADHSFYYQDFSVPDKKISAKGSWKLKGKKVILEESSKEKFHHVWTFSGDGKVARSRKGLTFYRLCRVDS